MRPIRLSACQAAETERRLRTNLPPLSDLLCDIDQPGFAHRSLADWRQHAYRLRTLLNETRWIADLDRGES